MQSLGFSLQAEACLNTLTSDIVKSSVIEKENLESQEVCPSIACRLCINAGDLTLRQSAY